MDGRDLLGRIAQTLGVPVSAFFDDRPLDDAGEMLRLCTLIANPTDRRKVIALMRQMVERQASSSISQSGS